MRKTKTTGFFDEYFRLEKLSKIKDPLEQLNKYIDFESFRDTLNQAFPKTDPRLGGRPPFDRVMMFKILILQRMYNLSDDNTEYMILDRLSFSRFLGLSLCDDVPDSKTIWNFKEVLKKNDTAHKLFTVFHNKIDEAELLIKDGAIVDASIMEKPRQRNTHKENEQLKAGTVPPQWDENPNKRRQKDTDADWTRKNNKNFFGYKNHIKVDNGSKLITNYVVTPAGAHDSLVMDDLLEITDAGQSLYGDSAYSGEPCNRLIRKVKMKNKTHKKSYRNKQLSDYQISENKNKSKVRARVEHVFGYQWTNLCGAEWLRSVGIERCAQAIALSNLIYNFFRSIFLVESRKLAIVL